MSDAPFPQYSNSAQTGERGMRIVEEIISDQFKWIFRRQDDQKEFGIDAHIELVDDNKVLGRMLAAQVKTGPSYLKRTNEYGYIYSGTNKHLNYFLNYTIPVILILCDPNSRVCWWCEVTIDELEETKDGWQVTVPFNQRLDLSAVKDFTKIMGLPKDYLPELKDFWRTNKLLLEGTFLGIAVPRTDVESGDITYTLDALNRIRNSRVLSRKYQENIDLSIFGYDEEPRELFELPEVRRWMEKLDRNFPYWLYFLSKDSRSLAFVALCLCDYSIDRQTPMIEIESKSLSTFLNKHFPAMNEICHSLGLDETEVFELSNRVAKFFFPEYEPAPEYAKKYRSNASKRLQ